MISRRHFILASAAAASGCQTVERIDAESPGDAPGDTPFSLGVASGDPTAESAILWTRVAPSPFAAPIDETIDVAWEVATDDAMRQVIASGVATARPELAHCIHVEATNLAPDRHYYYRFQALGGSSPIGRTRTLPSPGTRTDQFRIAMSSCMEYTQGYFTALRDLHTQQPNLVLHNGDYIYESSSGDVRSYPIAWEATRLSDYRALYAQYRQDTDLREAHRQFPWIVIWDDHEVSNDFGPNHFLPSRYNAPMSVSDHRKRVLVGRQAFLEHMPLRASLSLHDGSTPIMYRQDVVGDLLELNRLDVRSFRDTPVCIQDNELEFHRCPDIDNPARSMLGAAQEAWLMNSFGSSGSVWSCLAQTTMMAPFDREAGPAVVHEAESWDNYAANRTRFIEHLRSRDIRNPVSLGGNIHAFYAGTVSERAAHGNCPNPAMTEIVTTSVSAGGGGDGRYDDVHGRRDENPCVEFFENRHRGYTLLTFTQEELRAEFRIVDQTRTPDGTVESLRTLVVDDGVLGCG